MELQHLKPEFVAEAMLLTQRVFKDDDQSTIRTCFQEAVDPGSQPKFMKAHECSDIRYWVALVNERVVGVTGFYDKIHMPGVIWVSWFCVHPDHQKAGIGTALLQFTIQQARAEGYEYLKLFTANHEDERAAHRLYKRFGFEETHRERREGQELIFLQLKL